ncbi:hypothetical protein [Pseudomonas lini]|uniref:hypothetical protein n=1 Tax=Pseudomonas lini TaxID=163011 RepID=UPI0006807167|nr:hypothetical protein [Pseudomonas lini]KNH42982.1 hypothetical protein ACS73_28355 [Pseudomonas lini]
MSVQDWLICNDSDEIVEVVIHSSGKAWPRVEFKVLSAFLLYHSIAHPGAQMRIGRLDHSDKSVFVSEQDRKENGSKFDWLEWNIDNYMTMLARNNNAYAGHMGWFTDMTVVSNAPPIALNSQMMPPHISSREIAQRRVASFNHGTAPGSRVHYLKSELEGRQITTIVSPAYILGDDAPVVELDGIGTALLDKVEPFLGS